MTTIPSRLANSPISQPAIGDSWSPVSGSQCTIAPSNSVSAAKAGHSQAPCRRHRMRTSGVVTIDQG